jgi:hypothetical protein
MGMEGRGGAANFTERQIATLHFPAPIDGVKFDYLFDFMRRS